MNSRKWVYLFLTTLAIGIVSTIIIGFAVEWNKYLQLFMEFDLKEIISVAFWFLGVGLIFSLISQMGFFAYLTVHRFGLGLFKSLWPPVQILLIIVALFDLVYLRYEAFATANESLFSYIWPAVLLLVYGLIIAAIKMKQTNKKAFVPALFFIIVVTMAEWFPALRVNETNWLLLMVFPLIICNTWQLLLLHRLTEKS